MVMRIAAVLFFVGAIGTGSPGTSGCWCSSAIIGGLGVGIASVIAPAYIAEIAPAKFRGRFGSLQQLAIVTGIFISLLVDYIFAHARRRLGRDPLVRPPGLALDVPGDGRPAVIYGLLALTIPESPRYLIAKHRVPRREGSSPACSGPKNIDAKISASANRWSASRSRPGRT